MSVLFIIVGLISVAYGFWLPGVESLFFCLVGGAMVGHGYAKALREKE